MNITWTDRIGPRDRGTWLLFLRGDEIFLFHGKDIPGIVEVQSSYYDEKGDEFCTTYRLQVADDIRHISGDHVGEVKVLGYASVEDIWGEAPRWGVSYALLGEYRGRYRWIPASGDMGQYEHLTVRKEGDY